MIFAWLKRFLPQGLYGRSALILLVPIVTIQLMVSVVFIQRHFNGVTRQLVANIVVEIDYVLERVSMAGTPKEINKAFSDFADPLEIKMNVLAPGTPLQQDQKLFLDLTGGMVTSSLRAGLPLIRSVDLATNPRVVDVHLMTDIGPISIVFGRSRVSASNPHQLLVLMIVTSILMSVISIIFMRNQVRPIRRLARAAEAFGKGQNQPYHVTGATEVRSAGQAFLDMRQRIERQIEQRTLMLSGVSHDLRTPLTRLKLGLSLAKDDDETAAMLRDVSDMELMLDEFLAFSRGDSIEDISEIDPVQIAEKLVADLGALNRTVDFEVIPPQVKVDAVSVRPMALSRAIENLLSNATRYGNNCRLQVIIEENWISYVIEDDGPGIPASQTEDAVRPFIRLDQSRNQDRGTGVGLGLSIVLDIASSHGGALLLGESADLGGLKATLTIPR